MNNNGKRGEKLFAERMSAKGYIVENVSNDPSFWNKDIDFIIESPYTGEVKAFEVKYDSCINRTGNLYLELTNIHSQGGKGWYKFCEADVLAYGDAQIDIFHMIPVEKLREVTNQCYYPIGSCDGGESTGLLVPLKDLEEFTKQL